MNQPAGMLPRMSAAHNIYLMWKEYKSAKLKAQWASANPAKWEMITWIIAEQKKANNG